MPEHFPSFLDVNWNNYYKVNKLIKTLTKTFGLILFRNINNKSLLIIVTNRFIYVSEHIYKPIINKKLKLLKWQ